MKPRTKLQFEVIDNSQQLPNIEKDMLSWAKKDVLEHKGFATKTRVICMDCGNTFSPELVSRKKAVCPHCNTKLTIEQTKKRTGEQRTYIAYAEIYGEFQVIRNFELRSYHKSGEAARYYIHEILQHWILPNGKREVIARRHTVNWYCDSWGGSMEIQNKSNERKYDVYPQKYHPDSVFKAEYRKFGINHNLKGLTFLEAIKIVPINPKVETLLKAKQYGLLEKTGEYKINRFWPSIKICLRNKYKIKDIDMWFDYLDLLSYFRKDLNNAYYICPKNLKKAHDEYMVRKRKVMAFNDMKNDYIRMLRQLGEYSSNMVIPKNLKKEYDALKARFKAYELDKKKKKLEQEEIRYRNFIHPFLGLLISDGVIDIIPLKSIDDFRIEGDVLHHCVYTNEYFKKKDSLILSARIKDTIVETIEVNLKRMRIEQCRGLHNGISNYHEQILNLMQKNLMLLKERLKAQKHGTSKDVNRTFAPCDIAV